MLKTLCGNKSLILWKHNRNNANVYQPIGDTSYDNFVKEQFIIFFTKLRKKLVEANYNSFCKLWLTLSDAWKNETSMNLENFVHNIGLNDKTKILNKMRGNIGEIFAEQFFQNFGFKYMIFPQTYEPIDPENERFADAHADMSDGIKCSIQVKNYSGEIPIEILRKACCEDCFALREQSDPLRYLSAKRQILFSFTDKCFSPLEDDYGKIIRLIGPKEIDDDLCDNNSRIFMIDLIIAELSK